MYFKRIKFKLFILPLVLLTIPLSQSKALFRYNGPLNIELELNLSKLLLKEKRYYWKENGKNFLDAKILFSNSGKKEKKSILIQNGGGLNFYDSLPPLILKFNRSNFRGTVFGKFKKLTLMTHGDINSGNIPKVINHYLAYKQFSLLSPFSYRVRLVKIVYTDTSKVLNKFTGWGFFLEPKNDLLNRFPFKRVSSSKKYLSGKLDKKQTALLHAFNFFIQDRERFKITNGSYKTNRTDFFTFNFYSVLPIPFDFSRSVMYWIGSRPTQELNYIMETAFAKSNWLKYPGLKYSELKRAFFLIKGKRQELRRLYMDPHLPLEKKHREAYLNYTNFFFNFLKNRI
ncbi:MAG: hypothetical protein CME68_09465 [Halobacteriovoraceae bacterium]|nr:hypothetical protein [Halobacteriovoraceae bacterium]